MNAWLERVKGVEESKGIKHDGRFDFSTSLTRTTLDNEQPNMSAPHVPSAALLVSRDLFFTSKVTGTADLLGIEVQVAADAQTAAERLADGKFGCVFIDLADTGLDVAGFFARLSAGERPPVIAFGSHVATARLQAAREAGCDHVLPRSRFSADLADLLKKYCGPAGA